MTKKIISTTGVLLTLIFVLFSCNEDKLRFNVSGKLSNVANNHFYAAREVGDSLLIDTVLIDDNGKFTFSGSVDTLTVISLYFNQNTRSTYIFVDKGWSLKVEGDALYPDLINVKGGDINNDLSTFKKENKDLLKSRTEILNMLELKSNVDSVKNKNFVQLKNINFELSNIAARYVHQNPSKIASVMLINNFFRDESTIPRLDENIRLLQGEAYSFPLTLSLKRYSNKVKKTSEGAYAPNFTLKDLNGKLISLDDYKNKYLLLSFVATTCGVCNTERKVAVETYEAFKKYNSPIEFLTIMLDNEIEPMAKSAIDSVKWKTLVDDGGWAANTVDLYNIQEIPYNILISPEGEVLERNISLLALPEVLNDLLNKNTK